MEIIYVLKHIGQQIILNNTPIWQFILQLLRLVSLPLHFVHFTTGIEA